MQHRLGGHGGDALGQRSAAHPVHGMVGVVAARANAPAFVPSHPSRAPPCRAPPSRRQPPRHRLVLECLSVSSQARSPASSSSSSVSITSSPPTTRTASPSSRPPPRTRSSKSCIHLAHVSAGQATSMALNSSNWFVTTAQKTLHMQSRPCTVPTRDAVRRKASAI